MTTAQTTSKVDMTTQQAKNISSFAPTDQFVHRHIGPDPLEVTEMLATLECTDMDTLVSEAIPPAIRTSRELALEGPTGINGLTESEALKVIRELGDRNETWRSYLGMGYHGTITPPVILRTVLENPCWYTQYTPYQAELSQGRLEALLNFQTMIVDLTGLPIAGASLLDEGTAAAEAMMMCVAQHRHARTAFFVANDCHPQTIGVMKTRASGLDIDIVVDDISNFEPEERQWAGVLVQYPCTHGAVHDHSDLARRAAATGALVVAAADPLALCLLVSPGEWGADIAVGSTQRFGIPMGFGGPHAAYLSCKENLVRKMPGRLIGVSRDSEGNPALRMAIQTREQHIRRDKATSNICTAQVLLAIGASMYGVYHGPEGLRAIASRINRMTAALAAGLRELGHKIGDAPFFDTLKIEAAAGCDTDAIVHAAAERRINLRRYEDGTVGITFDETTMDSDIRDLLEVFAVGTDRKPRKLEELPSEPVDFGELERSSGYMTHPVFNSHRSETELLRYVTMLQSRDLSLAHSMIPLGSCTMKLNAASEMLPITWPQFSNIHPFAPTDQAEGYFELFRQLESWLGEITGFDAISLQPNAGSRASTQVSW